jgi:diguanylate cyclase (GGDEF)-like protein/PAS domain S-box-containing protein
MNREQQEIAHRVDRQRLDSLYQEMPANLIVTFLVAVAYAGVMALQIPLQSLLVWLGALTGVLLLRHINRRLYLRRRAFETPDGSEASRWWWRHRLSVLLTGLVLGVSTFLGFDQLTPAYQIFGIFVLAGLAAGALVVMTLDPVSYRLYVLALMIPATLHFAWRGTPLHWAIAILGIIYVAMMIRASGQLHRQVVESLTLGHKNHLLAEHLRNEKERLDSRLGRILNDSSNEIYVVNAHTLRCMQVNQGALEHLGYTEHEIVQLRITDIIADLTEEDLRDLIHPLIEGREESVFYHGYHLRRGHKRYPVEIRFQYSARENPPVLVATALDMTERQQARRQLLHQANFDGLTDLPNRFAMTHRLEQAFHHARRRGTMVALLFLDLDNFKHVNDSLGHAAGDELLKQAAQRIQSTLRESDTAGRLGGDEFLVSLEGLGHVDQAKRVAEKLLDAFQHPFTIGPAEIFTGVSIGISLFPTDGSSVEELMQFADIAMYQAKQQGGHRWHCFDHGLLNKLKTRIQMESALRGAIDRNELEVHYQPKVNTVNGKLVGAEALLRWHSPEFGTVPPDRFIPLAENIGLIERLGCWVLDTACREAVTWPVLEGHAPRVAVNVSPQQFRSGRLDHEVQQALTNSGLPADRLELEITESLLLNDCSRPLETLDALRLKGVHLALDDFGTGYSSLAYLKRFPLQTLKIDRSFIRDMTQDGNARALVHAIVSMAHALELKVVAEGVEEWQQLRQLRELGVQIVQGYYFSPPVDADTFRTLLERCSHQHPPFQTLAAGA